MSNRPYEDTMVSVATNLGRRARVVTEQPGTEEPHLDTKAQTEFRSRRGAGIAQWLERRTRDWKVAGSNPCWNGGRIFFSRVDFLCWLLFRYPFHPRVTTVARKKSRSFCQKCRWQVTAKHAYTLRIEPCFGIGHNLSLICQMTSEDIKHQLNNNNRSRLCESWGGRPGLPFLISLRFLRT